MLNKEEHIMIRKVLFILIPKDYRDEEFTAPYKAITGAGHTVDVAGFTPGIAHGSRGHEFTPSLLIDELTDADLSAYHAVVIPGGPGSTTYLWNNPRVQEIIRYFHTHKKLVAAICYACVAVAQSDILDGKKATVYPTDETKKIFKEKNVCFCDEGCVVLADDAIITAQGPQFADEFAQAILTNL